MRRSLQTEPIHTVTFDCWSTLIYEAPSIEGGTARRLASLLGIDPDAAVQAYAAAWRLHQRAWHRRVVFAGPDMLQHTLSTLGVRLDEPSYARLLARLEEDILQREVHAIEGARELLASLREVGIRTALICDTGFTPGRVLRQVLSHLGLLDWLELTIFSDEQGVPKPHPRAFQSALEGLGTRPQGAAHVGDLRRSDVAGARAAGMLSVRFRGHHDDAGPRAGRSAGLVDCAVVGCNPVCERPEADVVVDSYAALDHWLAARLAPHGGANR